MCKIEDAFINKPEELENVYKILLDNICGNVIIKDTNDIVLWVNNKTKALLEENGIYSIIGEKEEQIWKYDLEILEKIKELDQIVKSSAESKMGVPLITKTKVFSNDNGDDIESLYRIDKIPYMNSAGEVMGVVTFLLDTTHALDYQIKKYIDDVTYHDLRSKIGNIIKDLGVVV